ncbi:hypothetical protein SLS55_001141 [Diplodia seriata]|uniref:Uncharacterized protein n=1 Tax=Diplodia seriata TaxID=420778 RepID=A0ABR3CWC4_9PEZI
MLWACFRLDAEYDLCSTNLVSASWLRAKNIDPLRLERITDGPGRVDRIEGSNELVARVSLWWYGEDIPYRDQQVHLKERTLSGDFAVAEPGEGFDIIIGQESIREERLFQKEWYFYAQTTQGGHIPRSVSLNGTSLPSTETSGRLTSPQRRNGRQQKKRVGGRGLCRSRQDCKE